MIRPLLSAMAFIFLTVPAHATIDIERVVSPGGIEAWLVEDPGAPFMAIDLWFEGGASLDARGKRGATNLMTALLEEGAGDLDQQAFAERLESLAAGISFDTYRDQVTVSAMMLTQNRDEALELLRSALVEPRFDEAPIERVRSQVLAGIEQDLQNPQSIAGATFNALTFGDHPYGSDLSGTVESVSALTRDDLVAAHRTSLTRDRVSIGVAGDITAEELGPILDMLLADLPSSDIDLPPRAEISLSGGVEVVDFPSPQAAVYFGHEGLHRDDPDFFPLFIMNEVLGAGGFGSRLMDEVRKERGLTYGIRSWLSLGRDADMILGGFSSSNALVAEAIEVVRAQWADIAENGITAEELDAAQQYLTGAYPLRFDGNARIATILAAMQSDGMPIDYIETRNERVLAVSLEDVARVASEVLDPSALTFVVVGEPEGLAAE